MENMFREVSISEEDLEFLNNCIESHINRLKGRIKQLETNNTGRVENKEKRRCLKDEISQAEDIRSRLAEPFN